MLTQNNWQMGMSVNFFHLAEKNAKSVLYKGLNFEMLGGDRQVYSTNHMFSISSLSFHLYPL